MCANCLERGPSAWSGIDRWRSVCWQGCFLPGRRLPTTLALVLSLAPRGSVSLLRLLLPKRLSRKAPASLPSSLRCPCPPLSLTQPGVGGLKEVCLNFTQCYPTPESRSSTTHPQRLPRSQKDRTVSFLKSPWLKKPCQNPAHNLSP